MHELASCFCPYQLYPSVSYTHLTLPTSNVLFFRLLIVICKILSAFNQFCHDLIELCDILC